MFLNVFFMLSAFICRNSFPFSSLYHGLFFFKSTDIEYVTAIFQDAFALLSTFMFYPENELFHHKSWIWSVFFWKKGFFGPVLAKKTTFINWKSNPFLFFFLIFSFSHLLRFPISRLHAPSHMPQGKSDFLGVTWQLLSCDSYPIAIWCGTYTSMQSNFDHPSFKLSNPQTRKHANWYFALLITIVLTKKLIDNCL